MSLLYTGAPKQQNKKATNNKKWYCFKNFKKKLNQYRNMVLLYIGAPSNKETKGGSPWKN